MTNLEDISPSCVPSGLRIAFLHPSRGPITQRDWSGTPLGLITALRGMGVDVTEVSYDLPAPIRKAAHAWSRLTSADLTAAERSPLKRALRRRTFQRQFDRIGPVDGVIAVGSDCYELDRLSISAPVATYDDATLATMWAHEESDTRNAGFRPADVEKWIATQAQSSRAANVNCVSTAWAARAVARDHGIDPGRVAIVGMGHRPRAGGAASERDWSAPVFLFVGIDWRRKNGALVLQAFREVRARIPAATLHLVGRHDAIDEPGVHDHGLLARDDPAAQATLDRLLRMATAFVMPSRFDPSPIAYLEAASAGMPVIATSEGGAGELLGEGAIIVSPFDANEICAAMMTLADPDEARRRGRIAQEVAARSTWGAVARRVLAALDLVRGAA